MICISEFNDLQKSYAHIQLWFHFVEIETRFFFWAKISSSSSLKLLFLLDLVPIFMCSSNFVHMIYFQLNRLQTFKLPEPVLFVGGYLQIELLGRVQRQEMDSLYYIWSVSLSLFFNFLLFYIPISSLWSAYSVFLLDYEMPLYKHSLSAVTPL